MEVYRYATITRLEETRKLGKMESYHPSTFPRYPRHIFVLPEDPLRWGIEKTQLLLRGVILNHRQNARDKIVLIKFEVDEFNPEIFIRDLYEEYVYSWYPLMDHHPSEFHYPEVIVPTPIPIEDISLCPIPAQLERFVRFIEQARS